MYDEAHAPGPETSGTAFFTYGLLWGINNGYLTEAKYKDAALKGWNYLKNTALQKDGRIGYVQPIGEKAIPGQVVDAKSTSNFGVGAFLLAACEYTRYLEAGSNTDRKYWVDLLYNMAYPVLSNMAKGELQKNMVVEVSPTWDGRDKKVTYMEAFGRLMAGIAPWLALPDDNTDEGAKRKELRQLALASYKNAVTLTARTTSCGAMKDNHLWMRHTLQRVSCADLMRCGHHLTRQQSNATSRSSHCCAVSTHLIPTGCCSLPPSKACLPKRVRHMMTSA